MAATALFITTLALLIAVCYTLLQRRRSRGTHYPPGPKPLPFVGNLFDFTLKEPWLRITSWAEQYGDVMYTNIMGQGLVFLSSVDAAFDLFEKRGAIYSDRPPSTMAMELCGCNKFMAFAGYNAGNFRRHRRLLHAALGPASVHGYRPLITSGVHAFLQRVIHSPEQHLAHFRRFSGNQIMTIVYGYKPKEDDDPYIQSAEESLQLLSTLILPVAESIWLVDIFPFLKHLPGWFPGAGFKRKATVWRAKLEECADLPFQWVKEAMKKGTAIPCYCTNLLAESEAAANAQAGSIDEEHLDDIRWSANAMYFASIDTTITILTHLILAMIQNPDVLRKAQKELDAVTGMSRLPTHDDRPALPYIDAIMDECMRWTVPVPFGLPHRLTEDDVYEGMAIPKGTLVFANAWKMSRDPTLFTDPEKFVPERYLEQAPDEATARKRDPQNFVFGFGRRKCLGTHLVDTSLWLVIACMLATFDFEKATDENGNVIEPKVEYNDPAFRLPTPFPCVIRPRSEHAAQLVHDSLAAASA
ncbi:cytochrome P450 [Trametes polyzona]|nr:cytochrome P450 [Trametes polyzona]